MEKLGDILARLVFPGPGPLQQEQILGIVESVLGREARAEVRVGSYRSGKVVLEVRSAARCFEWQAFARSSLLARFRGSPGFEKIQDVRFQVGTWR